MDILTTPGTAGHTGLRLTPGDNGKAVLSVVSEHVEGQARVVLAADWLLPLAAWFAGEARPASLGDRPGTLYGVSLDVRGDESAVVWNTHTWARLDCTAPFGIAQVLVGPRAKSQGHIVMLWPEARQDVAAWLRRASAERWTRGELTA